MFHNYFYKKGVTAVELLVVLIVLSIVFSIALKPFSKFKDNQSLNSNVVQIVSLLNDARSATVSSKESSQYGVHFESGRAVYFKGNSFSEPSSYNREIILDSSLQISTISLNGSGSDVVFEQLTGETNNYGSVVFEAKSSTTSKKTINITQTGISNHD